MTRLLNDRAFRIKLVIAILLFLGSMLNTMDRMVFGVLAPFIRSDLSLSMSELGLAFGAFSLGYMLFGLVGGWCVDKLDTNRVLWIMVGMWSIICGFTAFAVGFWSLLGLRFLFGAAESPWHPAASKVTATTFSDTKFATIFALISSGGPLGGAVAAPMASMMAMTLGWRGAFATVAAMGLVWVVLWLGMLAVQRTRPVTGSIPEIRVAVITDEARAAHRDVLTQTLGFLRNRPVMALVVANATTGYLQSFLTTWFPSYLLDARGLNLKEMGFGSSVPWIVAFVTLLLGGYTSDRVVRSVANPIFGRKVIIVSTLGIAALCVAAIPLVASDALAVALMATALGSCYFGGVNYIALFIRLVGVANLGAATAFMLTFSYVTNTASPALAGYIIEYTGSYTSTFLILGGMLFFGQMAVVLFLRAPADRAEPLPQPAISAC